MPVLPHVSQFCNDGDPSVYDVGTLSYAYLNELLASGNELSSYLRVHLTLIPSRILSVVPVALSRERVLMFQSGLFGPDDPRRFTAPSVGWFLAQIISDRLKLNPSLGIITEEILARSSDHWIDTSDDPQRLFIADNTIYFHAEHPLASAEFVHRWMKINGFGYFGLSAVGRHPGKSGMNVRRCLICADELRAFAESIELAVLFAYDGEGCLVWVRESSAGYYLAKMPAVRPLPRVGQ